MMTLITTELDEVTLAGVHELAIGRGVSDAQFVADAVRQVVEDEAAYRTSIEAGIAAADRGDLIDQAEMERWFEERVAARRRV